MRPPLSRSLAMPHPVPNAWIAAMTAPAITPIPMASHSG